MSHPVSLLKVEKNFKLRRESFWENEIEDKSNYCRKTTRGKKTRDMKKAKY